MAVPAVTRVELRVRGTVQGVGFRPFVYRHAVALGLAGTVRNDSAGVVVDVEGDPAAVAEMTRLLAEDPPPLARIEAVERTDLVTTGERRGFRIVGSDHQGGPAVPVSVDAATCADCLAELFDPADRRYRYPFINCTNCGPRYTIVKSVPYDRPATTMAAFPMCGDCLAEYEDPADRRFHAQPNACPVCGPQLRWLSEPLATGEAALASAVETLLAGGVVAVKGVGGYHLACDAASDEAVTGLRAAKRRDDKPFAVMAVDLEGAQRLVDLGGDAITELTSPRRPIVIGPRQAGAEVAGGVAPNLAELGVFLAYSPLHHLLLADVGLPLVMTSGNLSDEPIAHEDSDALDRLGPLAAGVLAHDRPIHIRCDDSVVRASAGSGSRRLQVLRRSRGYAPEPVPLPVQARRPLLAVGAELKNTIAVAKGSMVVASHHIGDLEHLASYEAFLQAVDHLGRLYGVEPEVIAHDLHPEYLSTKWALEAGLPTVAVQHHHAHVASCLVEHGHTEPVLGVAFDGHGYGTDGTLWGGEFLVADLANAERVGNLLPVTLPGGTAAIRQPWRMAVAWSHAAGLDPARLVIDEPMLAGVLTLVERSQGPVTSSVGRLFDAVAALLGVRAVATYEGQAAIELEALARAAHPGDPRSLPFAIATAAGRLVLDPRPAVASLVAGRDGGADPAALASGFHAGLSSATVEIAVALAEPRELDTVVLTGGVFQNALLTDLVADGLRRSGLRVLLHERVPPNDAGISVGQAGIAAGA